MHRVTGSPWILNLHYRTFLEVAILNADQKERGLWQRECNLLGTLELTVFGPLFPSLILQALVENLRKWCHFLKNPHKGRFPFTKRFRKIPKLRWKMFIGERHAPFDTLIPFIPGSLHRLMYFPPKYKMVAQLLLLNETLDFSLEEECLINSDDDDIPFLAAVATLWGTIFPEIKVFMKIFCLHISLRSMNQDDSKDLWSSVLRSTSQRKSS